MAAHPSILIHPSIAVYPSTRPADGISPTRRRPQDYSADGVFTTWSQPCADGIFLTQEIVSIRSVDEIFLTQSINADMPMGFFQPFYRSQNPLL